MIMITHMTQHSIFLTTVLTGETTHIKSYVLWCKESLEMFENIKRFERVFLPILHTFLKHIQSVFLNLTDRCPCSFQFECYEPAVRIVKEGTLTA